MWPSLILTLCCLNFGTALNNSCSDEMTQENTDLSWINIGFIADDKKTTKLDPPVTYISCNVSIEWFYADYTEPYQIFKIVRQLDTQRQDIDLIVLLGLDDYHIHWGSILTTNKHMVKLHNRNNNNNQDALWSIVYKITNGSVDFDGNVTSGHTHCHIGYNATEKSSEDVYFMDTIVQIPPLILANIQAKEGWKYVNVIFDSQSEHVTRLYLDSLSHHRIIFTHYNMDDVVDFHAVLFAIYNRQVNRDQKIYVSIICSLECLLKSLHIANNFDSKNTEFPTLLGQFSRWMLLVYDYTPAVSKVIEKIANNLHNVVVVSIPQLNIPSVESITTRLKIFVDSMRSVAFDSEQQKKESYLGSIAKKLITMDRSALCTHYNIDSLLWTATGRKLQTVCTADLQGRVEANCQQLFPNIQYGYSRRLFKVVTNEYSPYVIKRINKENQTEFGGIYIDLLIELARVLNFTYELIEPPDGKWGVAEGIKNGTEVWNGMVGMLQRHEVDFVAAPLTIIPVRDKIIDFSFPVSYEYTSIVVKQPDPNAFKWRTLINPFKLEVLIYIAASLPIVTVLAFLIEKFGPFYTDDNNARVRKKTGGLHHIHDSLWYIYGALLYQGGVHLPGSFAGRIFVSSWWIFCIIIVGTYCGNLIAFLTVSKEITPFNTVEEMLATKGTYKWGTVGGTVLETVFVTSHNPQFRKVGDAMLQFNKSDSGIFDVNTDYHIARVEQGFYAYIADTTTIEFLMSSSCDLTSIKEKLFPMKDAFAFQQNSPHTIIFSEQIMKSHEAGLFGIWRRKWWPKKNFCTDKAKFESKPITLMDVQSASYVCCIGVFLGTVAFVAELLVFKLKNRQNRHRATLTPTLSDSSVQS